MKQQHYDVIIIGGGLAGLCLARQLKQTKVSFNILVIERNQYPVPEAAHKVGESTVELGSHYLRVVLGLDDHLKECHLPKAGLRFFFSDGSNRFIERRLEMGGNDFPPAPSFQIDRGRLENYLYETCCELGIDIIDGCNVLACERSSPHHIIAKKAETKLVFTSGWVVDASGRFGLLKRQYELQKSNEHNVSASWFRIQKKIDIDDWYSDGWHKEVPKGLRYYSTNHLMGKGYWVWIIPLPSNYTSIGIVVDGSEHNFNEINRFPLALKWLQKFEPQCAEIVDVNKEYLVDFHVMRNISYGCQQVFSDEKWCITGEAGLFLDPYYSPGTDFIAISNTFITQLICAEQSGKPINLLAKQYQQLYFKMYESSMGLYRDQYSLMGNCQQMIRKTIWDYAVYWGVTALLFTQGKLCDYEFIRSIRRYLQQIDEISAKMQINFRKNKTSSDRVVQGNYLNTLKIPELYSWQAELTKQYSEAELKNKIKENFLKIKHLSRSILS